VVHSTREYYSLRVIARRQWDRPTRGYHDRIEGYTGKMVVQIEAVSPLHIGSGDYELDSQGLYIPFARKKGLLYIPGTSIKGAIRAYAEALSPSCEGGGCRGEELCICCHIFGTQGLQGRVAFCDTEGLKDVQTQIQSVEARWSAPPARAPARGRRFYRHHAQPGSLARAAAQERLEVVPKWTKFKSEVFFMGLTQEEMGLLLLAMGLWQEQPFSVKMGGGKNRGLGSVRLKVPDGIQLVGAKVYKSLQAVAPTKLEDLAKETVPSYLAWLKQAEREVATNNLGAFRNDPPIAGGGAGGWA
jgi:CRISPR/Cas system CSM-associated protein Csm3 (group 7 of RAMP superfamily)